MTQLKKIMTEQKMNRRTARAVLTLFSQLFKASKKSKRRWNGNVLLLNEMKEVEK